MDILTTLKRLADAKTAQTNVWSSTQGLVTTDYDMLTAQVAALKRGVLDGEMSALRDLDGAEMPDVVRKQILDSVKYNEKTVSSVEELSADSFYNSSIIYVKSIPVTAQSISRAFANCYSLYAVLGVSFANAIYAGELFKNCYSLRAIKLSDGDFAKTKSVNSLFESCKSLTGLTLPEGSLGAVTDASYMFCDCASLTGLTLPEGSLGAVTTIQSMFLRCPSLNKLIFPKGSLVNVKSTGTAFSGCKSLTELILPEGSLGAVTDTSYMFYNCESLTELILPEGSLGAVTDTSYMFYNCESLTELILPEGSLGAVTTIQSMFQNCSALTSITFPEGSLGKCEKADSLFFGCSALQSVTLSATISATTLSNAFLNCSRLTSIDLHGMTRQALRMYRMFNGCISLKSVTGLDLSCVALTKGDLLKVNPGMNASAQKENFSIVVQYLFYNCNSLSDCRLSGTLYKSGVNLRQAMMLSAESLYSWMKALYDWETNEEGKTTDDEDHVLYMSAAQQQALTDYTGEDGENGEDAYLEAIAKGWTILN